MPSAIGRSARTTCRSSWIVDRPSGGRRAPGAPGTPRRFVRGGRPRTRKARTAPTRRRASRASPFRRDVPVRAPGGGGASRPARRRAPRGRLPACAPPVGQRPDPRLVRDAEVLVAPPVGHSLLALVVHWPAKRAESVVFPMPGSPDNSITWRSRFATVVFHAVVSCSYSPARPTKFTESDEVSRVGSGGRSSVRSKNGSMPSATPATGPSSPLSSGTHRLEHESAASPRQEPNYIRRKGLAAPPATAQRRGLRRRERRSSCRRPRRHRRVRRLPGSAARRRHRGCGLRRHAGSRPTPRRHRQHSGTPP